MDIFYIYIIKICQMTFLMLAGHIFRKNEDSLSFWKIFIITKIAEFQLKTTAFM